MSAPTQFWDSSALVALIFLEPHTPTALRAREAATRYMAWDWIQIEATAALKRRSAAHEHKTSLKKIMAHFQYIGIDSGDYHAIQKLIEKHGLRAADAGHLFCLKQAKKLKADIRFVCFDMELADAAESEGIPLFR